MWPLEIVVAVYSIFVFLAALRPLCLYLWNNLCMCLALYILARARPTCATRPTDHEPSLMFLNNVVPARLHMLILRKFVYGGLQMALLAPSQNFKFYKSSCVQFAPQTASGDLQFCARHGLEPSLALSKSHYRRGPTRPLECKASNHRARGPYWPPRKFLRGRTNTSAATTSVSTTPFIDPGVASAVSFF